MLWELDQFQGPAFLGFVRNLPPPDEYIAGELLPFETTFDLSFEYILGSQQRPVMASVIGYGSPAPISGRRALGDRVAGELPPIKRKTRISEREIIRRFTQPRVGTNDQLAAISDVYELAADLVDAVWARIEWLAIQALSEDKLTYTHDDVTWEVDFGLVDTHQIDLTTANPTNGAGTNVLSEGFSGKDWSNVGDAEVNPIKDWQAICRIIQNAKGFRPATAVMSQKAFDYMAANAQMREMARGTNAPTQILALDEVNQLLTRYNLPRIRLYDTQVTSESSDGSLSLVRPLAEGKVVFLPGSNAKLGNVLFGPTAEATRALLGTQLQTEAPGLFAQVYAENGDPPEEWIKAGAVAFPTVPGAELVGQMKVF